MFKRSLTGKSKPYRRYKPIKKNRGCSWRLIDFVIILGLQPSITYDKICSWFK